MNLAKPSLMAVSCRPRPSAARRLSRGMVYPLAFFQLLMQGGIFQSCCSLALTARGGECITGTGGEPVERGTYTGRHESLPALGLTCVCAGNQAGSTQSAQSGNPVKHGNVWQTEVNASMTCKHVNAQS